MNRITILLATLSFAALPACAVDQSPAPDEAPLVDEAPQSDGQSLADAADVVKPAELYYITTRPDYRKCISPLCGGHFIKAVNIKKTVCFSGTSEADCYVTGYDFSALGLPAGQEEKLTIAANSGEVVMRGHYEAFSPYFPVAKLVVSEAWLGASGDDPAGKFYGVVSNGIVCVTFPCLSFDETLLNHNTTGPIAGVDLSQTSASPQQVQNGYADLNTIGLVVAGKHFEITGPAGTAKGLAASEFYLQP